MSPMSQSLPKSQEGSPQETNLKLLEILGLEPEGITSCTINLTVDAYPTIEVHRIIKTVFDLDQDEMYSCVLRTKEKEPEYFL